MEFNVFVYVLSGVFCVCSVFVYLVDSRVVRRSSARLGAAFGSANAEFRAFQWRFLLGYLPCLFADSLQAPYLYYLYHSYGFLESQIAVLYVSGFVTGLLFTLAAVYFVQRAERRLLCLAFVGLNSLSCLLKFSDSYVVLLGSRVLDGVAGSLLNAPFQHWYVHEHVESYDFPKEWIGATFKQVALGQAVLAVFAGYTAELTEDKFKVTAFPFLLAIPILICGGFWIFHSWPPNRLDASLRPQFWPQFGRALRAVAQSPSVFLVSAIQAVFEASIYMFVFVWTPLFLYLKSASSIRPSFGAIYSCFMASVLVGLLVSRVLLRRIAAAQLLSVAAAVGFLAMALAVAVALPGSDGALRFQVLLVVFCTYQLAVGMYLPAMQRAQKELLPADSRAAVQALFRIPLNVIAAAGLILLHGRDRLYGNWMILVLCTVLLLFSLLSSLLLQAFARRAGPDLDHFVLQLRTDDSDDDVFA